MGEVRRSRQKAGRKKKRDRPLVRDQVRSHNTLEAICLGHPQDFLAFAQTQAAYKRAPIGTVYLSVAIKTSVVRAEIMQDFWEIYESLHDAL